jgi:cytochrome P450
MLTPDQSFTHTPDHYEIGSTGAPLAPLVSGIPILGNALSLSQDPVRFLLTSYQHYGSIFRINIFGKVVTVLAGKEANLFAQHEGPKVLSNHEVFSGLVQELGTTKNLANLEGLEHTLFRRTARTGYSATTMRAQTANALDFAHHFIDTLPVNSPFDVFTTLQSLTSLQLGKILTYLDGAAYIRDLQTFMNFLLYVHVSGLWPKAVMRLPAYKKAKARALEIANKIVTYHIENPPTENRPASLIDDFLNAHETDPLAMPMDAVTAAALGPFLAGQDTIAATTAFMVYAILNNQDLYARVQTEVDKLFANGNPQAEDFRHAEALHLTAIETLRRYPHSCPKPRRKHLNITATRLWQIPRSMWLRP